MSDVAFADVLDAEPAPRELTPIARRYMAAQATHAWVVGAVLLLVFPGVISVALVKASAETVGMVVVGVAVAAGLWWSAAQQRARLRKVLVDGEQRPARLVDVSHLVVRQGLARARRVTLIVEVDGRQARCVSWHGDLDDAEQGAWIRVLVHPQYPQLVIPVVSVT